MDYTVQQLGNLAGVSVRTLHHYDDIGLLQPAYIKPNGYRYYGERELLKLQQILFFKELDFSLEDIKKIVSSPRFDMNKALNDQKKLIELKKNRLSKLVKTIDKTLNKINHKKNMNDKELYDNFNTEEMDQYAEEAKQRWGHTDAYKQSQERVKKMTKIEMANIQKEADILMKKIALNMNKGATSPEIQALISQHYNNLRHFYEPNLEMYTGLADMYVADPRFTKYYEKYAPGLAQVMRDAMHYFADSKER